MDCPDLRGLFGGIYQIRCECSRTGHSYLCDPWLALIPCRAGHIYVFGKEKLGYAHDTPGRSVVKRLTRIPGVKIEQDGTDGVNLSFPLQKFSEVAKIVHPKKRRAVPEDKKGAVLSRLVAHAATQSSPPVD